MAKGYLAMACGASLGETWRSVLIAIPMSEKLGHVGDMKKMIPFVLVLAACAETSAPGGQKSKPKAGNIETCAAAQFQDLVGQDAIAALVVPDPKRSYRPDDVVTLEHRPERTNIVLDETDTIVLVNCG